MVVDSLRLMQDLGLLGCIEDSEVTSHNHKEHIKHTFGLSMHDKKAPAKKVEKEMPKHKAGHSKLGEMMEHAKSRKMAKKK